MSSEATSSPTQAKHETSPGAAILSLVIPGLGQISQGRYGKGLLFMVSLLGMFFLGQAMGRWQNVYIPPDFLMGAPQQQMGGQQGQGRWFAGAIMRWHYAGQFWIGLAAWPALWQYWNMPVPSKVEHPFWHDFQKMPDEGTVDRAGTVNHNLVNSDKTPDLGWVYTVIAGMLNILVIYDAYAGPALPSLPRSAPKNQAAPTLQAKKEGVA